jgi:GntR family transcriptional regulator/MocR family aminotransferase
MTAPRRPRRGGGGVLLELTVDHENPEPLHLQICDQIRQAVAAGRLDAGARLPATRTLAEQLGVARSTVIHAFTLLREEGYLSARMGAPTRIVNQPPDAFLAPPPAAPVHAPRVGGPGLSVRGRMIHAEGGRLMVTERPARPFRIATPAVDQFPMAVWERLCSRVVRTMPAPMMSYGDPAGLRPLREAVAAYVAVSRGIGCSADQVMITAGTQQAFTLVADLTTDPGDQVWVEDPGYYAMRGALRAAGLGLAHLPVDREGLDPVAGRRLAPDARLAVVTPSSQMPLGLQMSERRREELLAWARDAGAWILEDDYSAEFRYGSRPAPTLYAADQGRHVLYAGTFSKSLFPSMRLGYLVVPPDLVDAFSRARQYADFHPPFLEQAVMALMLSEGYFERHVRKLRAVYRERRNLLADRLRSRLGGLVRVEPLEAARHLLVWLPPGWSDVDTAARCTAAGVEVLPLSAFTVRATVPPALVLGYSGLRDIEIIEGADLLTMAIG